MINFSIDEIAAATGAACRGSDHIIRSVCTDTRSLLPGSLFVALTGERFDGHHYIGEALQKGAIAVISERPYEDPRVLVVKDTRRAFLDIAGLYRHKISPKVVAVTGSVGKTTAKEMAACVLSGKYKTLKTPKNLNNEVGLSETIFMLEQDTRTAVLELGVDGPGQMAPMSKCASPDIGIVTCVGVAHLVNFGARQRIFREKLDIRAGMKGGSPLLVCGDNDMLKNFKDENFRVLRYGYENKSCDIRAVNLVAGSAESRFDILWEGCPYPVILPAIGVHNVLNALAGFSAGVLLGVPPQEAARLLWEYSPEGMRQKIVKYNGFTVVEDCYNASPESMRAALDTLSGMQGRKIAVFSDMLELGEDEAEEHRVVGEYASGRKIDLLLSTGKLSEEYVTGAKNAGLSQAYHHPGHQALAAALKEIIREGDVLWVKASRGMRLEEILEHIYEL
jgi:UDP-N-acetylmuramoyl-tripeptide--D-alanyl-D-alanine ligase